ncbi:hypothetical protein GOM18_00030 [Mycoplasma hyopneumoniae]|nr:hypothetical protein [Mesomycoplasma hyopneumoniae]
MILRKNISLIKGIELMFSDGIPKNLENNSGEIMEEKLYETVQDTTFKFSNSQLKNLIQSVVSGLKETKTGTKTRKNENLGKKSKKKENAVTPSFLLKFSSPEEAKLINAFKNQAVSRKENPNKLLKSLILNTLTSESTLKAYTILKNDIYYALRKAVYTSLSQFYLRLEENNIEINHKFELINFKLNLVINLLLESVNKTQFEIPDEKLEDLILFKSLKQKQEQEYMLLKKKNQARKKEIYQSYHNFLLSEQVDTIINDESQLITKPNQRKVKSILEYLKTLELEEKKEKLNSEEGKNNEEKISE